MDDPKKSKKNECITITYTKEKLLSLRPSFGPQRDKKFENMIQKKSDPVKRVSKIDEDALDAKIAAIRKANRAIERRHQEVEADRLMAEKTDSAILPRGGTIPCYPGVDELPIFPRMPNPKTLIESEKTGPVQKRELCLACYLNTLGSHGGRTCTFEMAEKKF